MARLWNVNLLLLFICASAFAVDGWVQFEGGHGPGAGKRIVLISGDEEYRSEEVMPMLARILAVHHGFDCTAVFSMSKDGTYIDPNNQASMEGIEALELADLMLIATRFRNPPDDAMRYVDEYIQKGKPVIGLRTATHAFDGLKGTYAHYSNGHNGEKWKGGFGREILGEKWISHHGHHGRQSTRGIIPEDVKDHVILTGVKSKEIWGTTDVYGVRFPLPGDSQTLVLGAVLDGMNPDDEPIDGKKNDPMMPVVWTKTYKTDNGKIGKAVNTTMGASQDFMEPGLRRVIVNSVFWALGLEDKITKDLKIDFVGEYVPSPFGFTDSDFWKSKALQPSDLALEPAGN